jgi:hypothetical protein
MKIEIVGFYVRERDDAHKKLKGSLHAYLIDEGIDIRGINVIRKKDKIMVFLPHRTGVDEDTGEIVTYPVVTYSDMEKQKELKEKIIKVGSDYVKNQVLTQPEVKIKFNKPFQMKKAKTFTTRSKLPGKKTSYKVV